MVELTEEWENNVQRQIAVGFPEANEPVVVSLKKTSNSFDELPVEDTAPVTRRIEGMSREPEEPLIVTSPTGIPFAHEWKSWSWKRIAAYAIHNLKFGDHIEMLDEIAVIIVEQKALHPEWKEESTAVYHAFAIWSKRNAMPNSKS